MRLRCINATQNSFSVYKFTVIRCSTFYKVLRICAQTLHPFIGQHKRWKSAMPFEYVANRDAGVYTIKVVAINFAVKCCSVCIYTSNLTFTNHSIGTFICELNWIERQSNEWARTKILKSYTRRIHFKLAQGDGAIPINIRSQSFARYSWHKHRAFLNFYFDKVNFGFKDVFW